MSELELGLLFPYLRIVTFIEYFDLRIVMFHLILCFVTV